MDYLSDEQEDPLNRQPNRSLDSQGGGRKGPAWGSSPTATTPSPQSPSGGAGITGGTGSSNADAVSSNPAMQQKQSYGQPAQPITPGMSAGMDAPAPVTPTTGMTNPAAAANARQFYGESPNPSQQTQNAQQAIQAATAQGAFPSLNQPPAEPAQPKAWGPSITGSLPMGQPPQSYGLDGGGGSSSNAAQAAQTNQRPQSGPYSAQQQSYGQAATPSQPAQSSITGIAGGNGVSNAQSVSSNPNMQQNPYAQQKQAGAATGQRPQQQRRMGRSYYGEQQRRPQMQ